MMIRSLAVNSLSLLLALFITGAAQQVQEMPGQVRPEQEERKSDPCGRFKMQVMKPPSDIDFKLRIMAPDKDTDYKAIVVNPCSTGWSGNALQLPGTDEKGKRLNLITPSLRSQMQPDNNQRTPSEILKQYQIPPAQQKKQN